ncbi:MAG: hypothetical protein J3R72DRAFT_499837 [Linnemannia gamsii]|nr:MAG: hypothetical protein J3R72DRAFT_499837 [Linnemannia gamsii]
MAIAPALAAAQEESMNESAASLTEQHEKSSPSRSSGQWALPDQAKEPTPEILRTRGITHSSISISSLLTTPECKELINKGMIVSDGKLVENLWHALLDCEPEAGVLVDGFPRSDIQVECLKLPTFQICVLHVDEDISIYHQLMRGKLIKEHNAKVMRAGKGEVMEERVTDFDEIPSPFLLAHAELIIWFFKNYYSCLLKLSKIFPFHLINAVGSIDSVMRIILKEFHRQDLIRTLSGPYQDLIGTLSGGWGITARQPEIFSKPACFIDQEVSPIIARHAISGQGLVRSDNTILPDPKIVEVVFGILWERGYAETMNERVLETPKRVDSKAFEIALET